MSLKYILSQFGNKIGMNFSASSPNRPTGLRFVNEAIVELYEQSDMPGSLWENTFKVNGDQTITVPSYVGYLRGVREAASMTVWHFHQMRPRYYQFNWPDMWRNIRIRNEQALQATVTNASVGVISVPVIEIPPINITVSGPTPIASLLNETIIMDSSSLLVTLPSGGQVYQKQTVNTYTDYAAVTKDRINTCDVTLSDVDGKVLTVIPNNDLKALYQIIDVSACPWLAQNTSELDNYLELMYKKRLYYMSNDSDEFITGQYDNIVVNKCMQLWGEEQGKIDTATAYDAKATRSLARKHEEANRETEDTVAMVSHPHDTMLKRIGTGIRRRYALYAGRKY